MHSNQFLRTFFEGFKLSENDMELVLSQFKKVHFTKGDTVLKAGKTAEVYYFLEEGVARASVLDLEGNDISTEFYTKGDILMDWPSFFMRMPTKETYEALSDLVCWQLDYETFQKLFNSIEGFREAGRARLIRDYFGLKRKSISTITDEAKHRYLQFVKDRPHIVKQVPLKYIASYLGITDTSLSRIRREIAQGG